MKKGTSTWTAALIAGGGLMLPSIVLAEEGEFEGLPKGPGQEETFYTCSACHSIKLVLQQRLSRSTWEETLKWMVEEQGMDELAPDDLKLILDYLGTHLAPEKRESPFKQ